MANGILFLHAFPLDSSMWDAQVKEFSGKAPIAAPDFPGFGSNTESPSVMTMDDAADAGLKAIDAAGMEKAVVVGLSMGGYAALAFWRNYSERVAGLVLANTRSGSDDEAGQQRRKDLAARLKAEGNILADNPPALLSANASPEMWDRVKGIIRKQKPASIAAASLGMGEREDYTGDLLHVFVPTLIITSSGDTVIPPAATNPMGSQVRGADLQMIEGAGHLSNIEAPEKFNELLKGLLVRAKVIEA